MRLKGIKPVRAKGRVYYYHRKTMTRLPGEPGSDIFLSTLRELDGRESRGAEAAAPGTLGELIARYSGHVARRGRLRCGDEAPQCSIIARRGRASVMPGRLIAGG